MIKDMKSILGAAVLAISSTNAVNAATLVVENGTLLGATDVDVQGSLYDVSFVDGSCVAVFSGCDEVTDFVFQTEDAAAAASDALLDRVFVDGPDGLFDSMPILTITAKNNAVANIMTPFAISQLNSTSIFQAANGSNEFFDGTRLLPWDDGFDTIFSDTNSWAVWSNASVVTQPPSAVPLPAGGLLMLSAIAGLARLRCKTSRAS